MHSAFKYVKDGRTPWMRGPVPSCLHTENGIGILWVVKQSESETRKGRSFSSVVIDEQEDVWVSLSDLAKSKRIWIPNKGTEVSHQRKPPVNMGNCLG